MSDRDKTDPAEAAPITGLIVVPAYNEEANLEQVIEALLVHIPLAHLLFVDDGSQDHTPEVLERAGVPYLRHPVNLGYKEAMLTAIHYALSKEYAYVAFFDADGQHRTVDLLAMIDTFAQGESDFIIGTRFRKAQDAAWNMRRLGNQFFSWVTTLCSGVKITDVTCGLRLISRDYLQTILEVPAEDLHAELIVCMALCGARIQEIDIEVPPRQEGTSMYHFWKTVFYPAKTLLCLAGGLARWARTEGRRTAEAQRTRTGRWGLSKTGQT